MTEEIKNSVQILIGEANPSGPDSRYFGYWGDVELKRSIDTYSSITFSAPFEPDKEDFRKTFRPFSFQRLEALINLQTIFTGFMVGVEPQFDENSRRVSVTGYAKPAVFHDCCAPASALPLQFNGQQLPAIATKLGEPFKIGVEWDGEPGTPFKKCKLDIERKIQDFLVDLAKQQNRVLTDTPDGKLRFWQSVEPVNPMAYFIEGRAPLTKISVAFNPQEYFSEITGHGKKKRGHAEAGWTALNHFLDRGPLRPTTFKLEDNERADITDAVLARLGRMFANIASWTIEDLPGWRDPQQNLWQPNTTIKVTAPGAMIYRETDLLIRDVTFKQTPTAETTTLELVLPGAFSGRLPDALPWNEADA